MKTRLKATVLGACALVFLLSMGLAGTVEADSIIAYVVPPAQFTNNIGEGTSGLKFTPNQSIEATALGYFDANGDGLIYSHLVGIYNVANGTLLTSVTVSSGKGATLDAGFRYVPLQTPLTLSAGNSYMLVGYDIIRDGIADGQADSAWASVTVASQINSQGYYYSTTAGDNLSYPGISYAPPYFGPNLAFQTVPEPTTMLLLGLGLVGVGLLRRKS